MTMRKALRIARRIAGDDAHVSAHYGARKRWDRAIRISGCWPEVAQRVGCRIASALEGTAVYDAGFCAVWLQDGIH